PPGDRQAGAGHERKFQLVRSVVHLLGPLPVPGEVLVVEDRHRFAAVAEDLDDLLEELVARIFGLAFFVARAIAVLANEHDAIDGQFAAAQGPGVGDGFTALDLAMAGEAFLAEVAFTALLVHPEGDEVHFGTMMYAVPAIPIEETID